MATMPFTAALARNPPLPEPGQRKLRFLRFLGVVERRADFKRNRVRRHGQKLRRRFLGRVRADRLRELDPEGYAEYLSLQEGRRSA